MTKYSIVLIVLWAFCKVFAGETVIYNNDNRKAYSDMPTSDALDYKTLAKSVCLIVKKDNCLGKWATGVTTAVLSKSLAETQTYTASAYSLQLYGTLAQFVYDLKNKGYSTKYPICDDLRFSDMPTVYPPSSTGVLIGDKMVLTVAHAFLDQNSGTTLSPSDFLCVFSYFCVETDGRATMTVYPEDVYEITQFQSFMPNEKDLAIVKLIRCVDSDKPRLPILQNEFLKDLLGTKTGSTAYELFILGYPMGLPLTFADNGFIWGGYQNDFPTDLDAFAGNSGSPVFVKNGTWGTKIIGILYGGITDYVLKDGTASGTACKCWSDNVIVLTPNGPSQAQVYGLYDLPSYPVTDPDGCANDPKPYHGGISNPVIFGDIYCVDIPNDVNYEIYGIDWGDGSRTKAYSAQRRCHAFPGGKSYVVTVEQVNGRYKAQIFTPYVQYYTRINKTFVVLKAGNPTVIRKINGLPNSR